MNQLHYEAVGFCYYYYMYNINIPIYYVWLKKNLILSLEQNKRQSPVVASMNMRELSRFIYTYIYIYACRPVRLDV